MGEVNKVTKFDHKVFGSLRVVVYKEKEMFVAKDVVNILGYTNQSKTLKDHCKSLIKLNYNETLQLGFKGFIKGIQIIPEKDVYRLIMRSKLPSAEEFQDWVCEVVLPTLRKEAMYVVDEEKVVSGEMTEDELVFKAMTLMQTKIERLQYDKEVAEKKLNA